MQLRKSMRKHAKIKCALQGPSGSGKTMSALLLAYGITGDWQKIAVIDTENSSSDLYAHLGEFNVLPLQPPFTPEKYIQAITACEKAGVDVVIIDSLSHEWEGTGGVLETHSNIVGNSFANWSKLTPRHNAFLQAIIQSPCHIIGTLRSKQDYVLSEKNGKMVPEKVGLKGIQREGTDYEFTLVLELDVKHMATASKDRTQLFIDKPSFVITPDTGRLILQWCNSGSPVTVDDVSERISECRSIDELLHLYKLYPQYSEVLKQEFAAQKRRIQINSEVSTQLAHQQINHNGTE